MPEVKRRPLNRDHYFFPVASQRVLDDGLLLAALENQPADVLGWRVYADLLEEHGQQKRSEFVRRYCGVVCTAWANLRHHAISSRDANGRFTVRMRWCYPLDEEVDMRVRVRWNDNDEPDNQVLFSLHGDVAFGYRIRRTWLITGRCNFVGTPRPFFRSAGCVLRHYNNRDRLYALLCRTELALLEEYGF